MIRWFGIFVFFAVVPGIVSAATFTLAKNLSFGTLAPTAASGSVVLSLNGSINTNSAATVISSGTAYYPGQAVYTGNGLSSVTNVVTMTFLNSSVTLSNGAGGTVTVNNFTITPNLQVLLLNPSATANVGGTMNFTAASTPGTYTGLLAQATYGRMRVNGRVQYQTMPESYLHDYGAFGEYRWDKNTYVQATWNHDCRSNYVGGADVDAFGVGVGRLFKFGGLTFNVSSDTGRNLSLNLTYNISFGKIPDSHRFFANAENQMMDYGTIYARATDDAGNPVAGVDLFVSGRESPSRTDANGGALITNLETYQKVTMAVDESNVDDISLTPEWTQKKLVLRPGVVRPVDIPMRRLGGIEGQLAGMVATARHMVRMRRMDGTLHAVKTADLDGAFIFDGLPYDEYVMEITDGSGRVICKSRVRIKESFRTIRVPINVSVCRDNFAD